MGSNKKLSKGVSIRGGSYIYEIIGTNGDDQFVASVKMSGELGSIDSQVRVLMRQYDSTQPAESLKAEALKVSCDFIESIEYEESVLIVLKFTVNDSYVGYNTHDDESNDERTEYQEAEDDGFVHFDNGRYIGDLKDGQPHGNGKMLWNDHTVYDGEWVDGYMHGNGTMTWPSGKQYTGEWKNSKQNGHGQISYPDGRIYTGMLSNGLRHGFGVLKQPNGERFEGTFANDNITKEGIYYLSNGKRKSAFYKIRKYLYEKLLAITVVIVTILVSLFVIGGLFWLFI